jgi:hypothetical protein
MYVMYDSVTVSEIPHSASAVAGYVGGRWPTYSTLVKEFPHAQHLSIAVNAGEDAECLDIESGDATIADAPTWFRRQKGRGVTTPCFYTSLSNVDALVAALNKEGIHRPEYRLWSAHYTYRAHVCGPPEGISVTADATQWTDRALGRNLDESLCDDAFFPKPAPRPYENPQEVNWTREWDRIKGRRTLAAHLRRLFLKAQMRRRQAQIQRVAQAEKPDGWSILNRKARYRALAERTK